MKKKKMYIIKKIQNWKKKRFVYKKEKVNYFK